MFFLTETESLNNIFEKIQRKFKIQVLESASKPLVFWDTFEWLLLSKNHAAFTADEKLYITNSNSTDAVFTSALKKNPTYINANTVANKRTSDLLKKFIKVRAMVPKLRLVQSNTSYAILNKDDKIIAKFYSREYSGAEKLWISISLNPLRGFEKDCSKIVKFLEESEAIHQAETIVNELYTYFEIPAFDYQAKPSFQLQPNESTGTVVVNLLTHLFSVLQKNVDGIIEDIDSEFLHDFRVASRRGRSLLNQVKQIFSEDELQQLKSDLRYIGNATNLLRDLDVYLLKENEYRAAIPEHLHPGLAQLFKRIRTRRKNAHKKLVAELQTGKIRDILTEWQHHFNNDFSDSETAKNFEKPVLLLSQKFIYRRYAKIREISQHLKLVTKDDEIHELRIECKKLRYMIEFFASLFPKDKVDRLIKQLKILQDNLGDFNDFGVQSEFLQSQLDAVKSNQNSALAYSAALGGLIAVLNSKKAKVRSEFHDKLDQFLSPDNIAIFEQLFQVKKGKQK